MLARLNAMKHLIKKKWQPLVFGLLVTIFFSLHKLSPEGVLGSTVEHVNYFIYDRMLAYKENIYKHQIPVTIVNLDRLSLKNQGNWPWKPEKIQQLIDTIKQSGAKVAALDLILPEAYFKDHPTFFQHLKYNNIVLGFAFQKPQQSQPYVTDHFHSLLNGYSHIDDIDVHSGFINHLSDEDGVIRRAPLIAKYNNTLYPSLALAITMNFLNVKDLQTKIDPNSQHIEGILLGEKFIPTTHTGHIFIPFWGTPGTVEYVSANDILEKNIKPNQFNNHIVIIGSNSSVFADLHQTPVSCNYPGVEIIANIVKGMIEKHILLTFNWDIEGRYIYLLLFGLLLALTLPFLSINALVIVTLGVFVTLVGIFIYFFIALDVFVPITTAFLILFFQLLFNYIFIFVQSHRERRKIEFLFGQYVPSSYVSELIAQPDGQSITDSEQEMSILFSDIRQFTPLSEKLTASQVKELLNLFFTHITEIIFNHHGTVDKYVGDMVIAFWGAPIKDKEHGRKAIDTAVAIRESIPIINQRLKAHNLPEISIGIGIASGIVNVGDMGSDFRRSYTVIGDTVNLAARLEELTKYYDINILANNAIRSYHDHIVWRLIDKVNVRGKKKVTTLYQPLCYLNELEPDVKAQIDLYHKALEHYFNQEWAEALAIFENLLQTKSDQVLYQLYIHRIHHFIKEQPPKDWDGVYSHHDKL